MHRLAGRPVSTRPAAHFVARAATLAAFAFWFGGFTFYAATVQPMLHDELGPLDSGRITGQVAAALNAYGIASVVGWWVVAWLERSSGGRVERRVRWGLIAATTAVLAFLIALHPVVSARLDEGSMRDFRRLHLVYLNASTVQWFLNLLLLVVSTWIWRRDGQMCTDSPSPCPAASITASE
jgi:hypothetical protein